MPFFSAFTGSFAYGRRASAFRRVWNPGVDITPAVWVDASDASSYTLVNTKSVGTLTDKAGHATFTATSVTGGGYGGTLNGLNTFTAMTESANIISTNEFTQADNDGNHWAIGVFYNPLNINDTQDSFWSVENNTVTATSKRDYAISAGNASQFDGELDLDGLSSNRISSTIGNLQAFDSGIAQNTWVIITAIFNKTGNQIAVRVDGADAFTPVNDYDTALNTNLDLRLFRNRANESMRGRLAEFFSVADVPGTGGTDISTVEAAEGYLAWKWGLTASLPVDHPYKTKGPATIANYNPGGGGGAGSFTWGGDRGIVAGGTSTGSNVIQYYDIATAGNAQDFGDLNYAPTRVAGLSNGTRAVIGGGFNGFTTYYNTMDYITVATTGNAQDLGDLSQARSSLAGASDATTGIFAGGANNAVNFQLDTIDSFTIATTGNASDFGNLTQGRSLIAGWNNATRAVFAGGDPAGATQSNVMDYITIASAGDATDFGDMTDTWNRASGAGDATYALFAGGRRAGSVNANGWTENIDYVTVATTGNATDFGDLTTFKDNVAGNSNGTRATFSGGSTNTGSNVTLNNIDYVTVATPGNATDFGDLLAVNESAAATSGSAS